MEQAEAFSLDQITMAQRALIPPTIKSAYAAADLLIKDEPILNTPSAIANKGRIIQWAVDFAFERLVASQQWPFDFCWRDFERPTGKYLEIRPSHSVITISQVKDHTQQPRDVKFRMNKRMSGQGWLLRGVLPPDEEQITTGIPHILLLHGHQEPNFSYLAMPKGDHESGFHYKSNNLMLMPHAIVHELPVEQTDIDAVITLKEEIDRWRRDNYGE